MSIDIVPEARFAYSRLCWAQKHHGGENHDVWILDDVVVLKVLPSHQQHHVQFDINLGCGETNKNNRYMYLKISRCYLKY